MEEKVLDGQMGIFDEDVVDANVEREEIVSIAHITTTGVIDMSGIDRIIKDTSLMIAKLDIENMEATEENLKVIKATASNLNKQKKEYDDTRKLIQKEWNTPLEPFLVKAKELNDLLEENRLLLVAKSDEVEKEQLAIKTFEIKDRYNLKKAIIDEVLVEPYRLDKVTFEDMNLHIIKSNSNSSYEKLIDERLDQLQSDLKVIESHANSIRLLSKWEENNYNLSKSLLEVQNDIIKEEEVNARIEASKQAPVVSNDVPEAVVKEEPVKDMEKVMTATFNMKGKRGDLIKVREYAKGLGVEVL